MRPRPLFPRQVNLSELVIVIGSEDSGNPHLAVGVVTIRGKRSHLAVEVATVTRSADGHSCYYDAAIWRQCMEPIFSFGTAIISTSDHVGSGHVVVSVLLYFYGGNCISLLGCCVVHAAPC